MSKLPTVVTPPWAQLAELPEWQRTTKIVTEAQDQHNAAKDEFSRSRAQQDLLRTQQELDAARAALAQTSAQYGALQQPQAPTMPGAMPQLPQNINLTVGESASAFLSGLIGGDFNTAANNAFASAQARQQRQYEQSMMDYQTQAQNAQLQYRADSDAYDRDFARIDREVRSAGQLVDSLEQNLMQARQIAQEEMRQTGRLDVERLKANNKTFAAEFEATKAKLAEMVSQGVLPEMPSDEFILEYVLSDENLEMARANAATANAETARKNAETNARRLDLLDRHFYDNQKFKNEQERIKHRERMELESYKAGQAMSRIQAASELTLGRQLTVAEQKAVTEDAKTLDTRLRSLEEQADKLRRTRNGMRTKIAKARAGGEAPEVIQAMEAEAAEIESTLQNYYGPEIAKIREARGEAASLAPPGVLESWMQTAAGLIKGKGLAPSSGAASNPITAGQRFIGTPYKFGGTGNRGIDCSAFTQAAMRDVGIKLPRTADMQWADEKGKRIPYSQAQPGDLLFFHSTYGKQGKNFATHCGIYVGNGKILHASSAAGKVAVTPIGNYLRQRLLGAKRFERK